jgi:endonuclease G, mitochondrial
MKVNNTTPASAPRPKAAGVGPSKLAAVLAKRPAAATSAAPIADVEKRFGWKTGSWQDKLLTSADSAGNKDSRVSKAEIEAYLSNPADAKFVTSSILQSLGKSTAAKPQSINGLTGGEKSIAKAADRNRDGSLSKDEFVSFSKSAKGTPGDNKPKWIADQQSSMFASSVASVTGEKDALLPKGFNGPVLDRSYMRIVENEKKLAPNVVSYTLSANDIAEAGQVPRIDNFRADPDWAPSPSKKDYNNTGFDRGHMKPADDSPNAEAMDESFLMTNMAPQHGALNQATWRYLEAGVNELVQATKGKATIHTGNLYLDAKGNPLPENKIQYTGSGDKKIGVPTHNFKSVLLETPDGKKQLFSFIVPNSKELKRDLASGRQLLLDSRVSTEALEKKLGQVNLFPTLSAAESKQLKAIDKPVVSTPLSDKMIYAKALWG